MTENMNKNNDWWNLLVWFLVGFGGVKLGEFMFPGLGEGVVRAFFMGAGLMFLGLTILGGWRICLLYTSPSPRDGLLSRMPSSA